MSDATRARCPECDTLMRSNHRCRPLIACATDGCEVTFRQRPAWNGQAPGRYCSRACTGLAHRSARFRDRGHGSLCEICEKPYRPTYPEQRTCGRECGVELRRQAGNLTTNHLRLRLRLPECPDCGAGMGVGHRCLLSSRVWIEPCATCARLAVFRARRGIWACSKTCYDQEYNRKVRPHPAPRSCTCGSPAESGRHRCAACAVLARRLAKERERRRRRALEKGAIREPYALAEIAERDRYRCGINGCKVEMNRVVPHPRAPTIDHVVPLSISLDDTRANVQLACFICNSRKGARSGTQQLALIG